MKNTVIVCVIAGSASAGFGSIVNPTADPLGSLTYQTLLGSEGVPLNNDRWSNGIDNGEASLTYWANKPIVYSADLVEDDWRVGLTARNYGELPEFYTKFTVDVFANDVFLDTVELPAIQDEYRTTWFDIGQQGGLTDLKLVWKNDFWDPDVYDANIVIGAVQFGRAVPGGATAGVLVLAGLVGVRRRR